MGMVVFQGGKTCEYEEYKQIRQELEAYCKEHSIHLEIKYEE